MTCLDLLCILGTFLILLFVAYASEFFVFKSVAIYFKRKNRPTLWIFSGRFAVLIQLFPVEQFMKYVL